MGPETGKSSKTRSRRTYLCHHRQRVVWITAPCEPQSRTGRAAPQCPTRLRHDASVRVLGPKEASRGIAQCCGRSRLSGHSLRPQNQGSAELTKCRQSANSPPLRRRPVWPRSQARFTRARSPTTMCQTTTRC